MSVTVDQFAADPFADHSAQTGPLVGVSCLARGADQVFARVVLELGGGLEILVPASDYRERRVEPDNLDEYDALVHRATTVRVLPFDRSSRDAYAAANEKLLSGVDLLVAVWDGAPPDGKGGTGDTVRIARRRGIPLKVVWPKGATRKTNPRNSGMTP